MRLPKTIDQKNYMGKICYFNGEYYRDYGKEKSVYEKSFFHDSHTRKTPVKWKIQKHRDMTGWIVGFGFCFNGTLETEVDGIENYKFFRASKRINYARIRVTPTGKELKIPLSKIRFKK